MTWPRPPAPKSLVSALEEYYEDIIRAKSEDRERLQRHIEALEAGMKEQQEKLATYKEELRHEQREK